MSDKPIIGVIGGMGPQAGLDLLQKIFDETIASSDQGHVPVALLSFADRIADRSEYLIGKGENPVPAIVDVARRLERTGASVLGIPCNTAHAEHIYDAVSAQLRNEAPDLRLLHIIEETIRHIVDERPGLRRIGVISTYATFRMRLYQKRIEREGLTAVLPDDLVQRDIVHKSIFLPPHGIKAQSSPISAPAREALIHAIDHLKDKGAECVILACTELPLAVREVELHGLAMIDPTRILARALLRETYPEKLRNFSYAIKT